MSGPCFSPCLSACGYAIHFHFKGCCVASFLCWLLPAWGSGGPVLIVGLGFVGLGWRRTACLVAGKAAFVSGLQQTLCDVLCYHAVRWYRPEEQRSPSDQFKLLQAVLGACGRRVVFNLSQWTWSLCFLSFCRSFNVRRATTNDLLGVEMLVQTLSLNESILNDLKIFTAACRDPVSIACKYTQKRMDKY